MLGATLQRRLTAPAEPRPLLLAEAALAGAGLAFAGMAERARGDALVVGDAEVVFLEPADLVAQPRGFLELEVGGGLAHAVLEVADIGLEIVADEVRALLVAGIHHHSVPAGNMGHDVVDVALDALGRDPVFLVV